MTKFCLIAALIAAPLAAHAAPADPPPAKKSDPLALGTSGTERPSMNRVGSAFLLIGYGAGYGGLGYGVGARYQLEVVPESLIKWTNGFRDEIGIEFGLDFVHYSFSAFSSDFSYNEFIPTVGARWNFWFNDQFAAYPAIDLAFRFGTGGRPGSSYGAFLPSGAVGGIYKTGQIFLRAEAGSYLLRLGAGLKF